MDVVQPRVREQSGWNPAYGAGFDDVAEALVRAPHPLTRVPSQLRWLCPCVAERWWLWGWFSDVNDNNLEGTLPTELGLMTALEEL